MSEIVEVTLGGQEVSVSIDGGNVGAGASVLLADLNAAVSDAEQSAADAAESAAAADAAVAAVPGLIANKADTDGGNLSEAEAAAFRTAIGADQAVNVLYQADGTGAQQRTLLAFARTFRLATNYANPGDDITNGTTSARLALQRAIDSLPADGGCVILPEGAYMIDSVLAIYKPVKFLTLGGAGSAKIKTNMVTGDVIDVTAPGLTMDGVYFESTVVKTAGAFIKFGPTAPFWHITNFQMRGHYIGFEVDGASLFTCSNGHFRNATTRTQSTGGAHMVIGRTNLTVVSNIDNLSAGKDGGTALTDMPSYGIRMQYVDAIVADNCDLTVSGKAWSFAPQSGQICANVNITGICHGDSGEVGYAFEPAASGVIVGWHGQTVWGASNTSDGVIFGGAGDIIGAQIVTPQFVNNSGNGVSFDNAAARDIRIGTGVIAGNDGSGVFANTNCDGFSFLGTRIGPSDNYPANLYAAFLGGGLTDYAFIDCDMRGNTNPYTDASKTGDVRGCAGVVTQNKGIQEITAAQTAVVVNHDLLRSPGEGGVQIAPRTAWQSSTNWWVDTITDTSFTLHVNPAPGSSVFFGWAANCEQR